MAETFRLATFNVENLFARYRFRSGTNPHAGVAGFTINNTAFDLYDDEEKRITAAAIREVDADIICLQEIENLQVLDRFVSRYLPREGYDNRLLIDGNDPRQIDVAILSRYPIVSTRTNRHLRANRNGSRTVDLFSRDCLVADVEIKGHSLTLYVNHFKSMMGGRPETKARRLEQVKAVKEIVDSDWKDADYIGNFVVLGDFNDYVGSGTSLNDLIKHPQLVDIGTRIPAADRWTHFWAKGGEYRMLDYILLSKALDDAAERPTPGVMRKGLPWRAEKYKGDRLSNVGSNEPKASDHAPLFVELPLGAVPNSVQRKLNYLDHLAA